MAIQLFEGPRTSRREGRWHRLRATFTRVTKPLSATWHEATQDGSWLDLRIREYAHARRNGWEQGPLWIRSLARIAALAAFAVEIYLVLLIGKVALHNLLAHGPHLGLTATITRPVHAYFTAHAAQTPLAGHAFTLWAITGVFAFLWAVYRSTLGRITWIAWGAATLAMIWTATPAPGRPIAFAVGLVEWFVASGFALDGMTPLTFHHVHYRGDAPVP